MAELKSSRPCVESHSVYVMDRGGEKRVAELTDLTQVQWERRLDSTSSARVEISGRACRDQASRLAQVEPRRHELAVYRGGDRVWEGPIVQVERGFERVIISARDVTEYLHGTALSKDWPSPENGGPELMGDRIEEIIEYELTVPYTVNTFEGAAVTFERWEELDPPANVLPFLEVRAGSVLTRSDTVAFQMPVGEHLDALAESGLDYTTIGRKLLIWDSSESIGQLRVMTVEDFDGRPVLYSAGQDLRVVQHVVANRDEESGGLEYVGTSGAVDPYYGAWTSIHSRSDEDDEPSQDALNTQARRLAYGRNPVPEELVLPRGASIRLDTSLTIDSLVAGVEVPVLAEVNGRTVNQVKRLASLKVTETGDGETITGDFVAGG